MQKISRKSLKFWNKLVWTIMWENISSLTTETKFLNRLKNCISGGNRFGGSRWPPGRRLSRVSSGTRPILRMCSERCLGSDSWKWREQISILGNKVTRDRGKRKPGRPSEMPRLMTHKIVVAASPMWHRAWLRFPISSSNSGICTKPLRLFWSTNFQNSVKMAKNLLWI